jgi:hypothetical protein
LKVDWAAPGELAALPTLIFQLDDTEMLSDAEKFVAAGLLNDRPGCFLHILIRRHSCVQTIVLEELEIMASVRVTFCPG